jgi:hypothetical protein
MCPSIAVEGTPLTRVLLLRSDVRWSARAPAATNLPDRLFA